MSVPGDECVSEPRNRTHRATQQDVTQDRRFASAGHKRIANGRRATGNKNAAIDPVRSVCHHLVRQAQRPKRFQGLPGLGDCPAVRRQPERGRCAKTAIRIVDERRHSPCFSPDWTTMLAGRSGETSPPVSTENPAPGSEGEPHAGACQLEPDSTRWAKPMTCE